MKKRDVYYVMLYGSFLVLCFGAVYGFGDPGNTFLEILFSMSRLLLIVVPAMALGVLLGKYGDSEGEYCDERRGVKGVDE